MFSKFFKKRRPDSNPTKRVGRLIRQLRIESLESRQLLATLTVTTASDAVVHSGLSLRDAIVKANTDADAGHSDTIDFASGLSGDKIKLLQGPLTVDGSASSATSITINGNSKITVCGESDDTAFDVSSGTTAVLTGLTVTAATATDGVIVNDGTLTVTNSTVSGNTAGVGIENTGASVNANLHVNLVRPEISVSTEVDGTLTINNSTISGNSSTTSLGSGIDNESGTVTINSSKITGNVSDNGGGGINNSSGTVTVNSSTISGNTSVNSGGGIANAGGTVTVNSSTISGNLDEDDGGGGISSSSGTLIVSGSTISTNTAGAGQDGGGIYISGGLVTVSNSTISGNHAGASGNGGGIYTDSAALTVTGSTISGNFAGTDGEGGGIFVDADDSNTATVSNSTITGNIGPSGGGGIYNNGTLTLSNATVAGNLSYTAGGGIVDEGTLTLLSTIIAGNNAASDVDLDEDGTLTASNSLIGDGTSTGLTTGVNGNVVGTTASPINAQLGVLANNGGTTLTLALKPASPAINTGGGLTTLAASLGAGVTTFPLSDLTNSLAITAGTPGSYLIQIDNEQILLTSTDGVNFTAKRGVNGTADVTHNVGAIVTLPTDQTGHARVGVTDIGAIEFQGTTPTVVAIDTGGVYKGTAFVAKATVNGAASLGGVTPTLTYYAGASASGTPLTSVPVHPGTYTVVASYAGSAHFTAAVSNPTTFTITKAPTVLIFVPSTTTATVGQTVTFTATLIGITSAQGVPTGSVTFSGTNGVGTIGTAPISVVGGVAKATLKITVPDDPGAVTITATYCGDANFLGSTVSGKGTIKANTPK